MKRYPKRLDAYPIARFIAWLWDEHPIVIIAAFALLAAFALWEALP